MLNEHGDVTQLRREDGTCKTSYEYDAFGIEKNPKEDDENPFRYCGEYLDSETNAYYLRARSYNPATGRFQAEDSVHGITRKLPGDTEVPDPLSLNRYTYAHNDPAKYQDPSGHIVITTTTLVIGAAAIIGGLLGGAFGKHLAEELKVAQKDQWKYILGGIAGGALAGGALGYAAAPAITAATGIGAISLTSGGLSTVPVASAGASGFEQARQLLEKQQAFVDETLESTRQEVTPVIGNKLNYLFGQATGSKHNIDRSLGMLNQLNRIGIHDTEYWRNYMFQRLWQDYYIIPTLQENGKYARDSLLVGQNGMLKMETIWQGGKLITIELFGKADSWFH